MAGKTKNEVDAILDKVLLKIKPSKEEEKSVKKITDDILLKLNKGLEKVNARAVLGGSGAKKTWLAGNYDIDIFVKFDYDKYREESEKENGLLSNILELVLRKSFSEKNIERVHGSRDYFNLQYDDFVAEIVPVLEIKDAEQALNITDVSPMHAEWVSWMVDKNPGIENQVRLTKAFCKANNAYGAESYILGFSGYICEILTIYYGSFTGLLENASKWEQGVIVDSRNYYKNKSDIFVKINKDKIRSPMIIIDPVQKDRNAAAALSIERFDALREAAKKFLENPSEELFVKKEVTIPQLKKDAGKNDLFIISLAPLKGKRDVVGSKLLKVFEFILVNLKKHDFKMISKGRQWSGKDFADEKNDAMLWFIVPDEELSEKVKRMGPPVSAKEFFEDFKAKHKEVVIENKRSYAFVKREFRTVDKLLEALKKDNYIKDRVKNIQIEKVN